MRISAWAGLLLAWSAWAADPPAKAAPDAGTAAVPAKDATGKDASGKEAAGKDAPKEGSARPVVLIADTPDALDKAESVAAKDRATNKTLTTKLLISHHYALGVFVDGYTLPKSRRVGLSADLQIIDPEGNSSIEKVSVGTAKIFDPKLPTVYLRPALPLQFGLTDAEGVYTVKVRVYDEVRGETSHAESKFTLSR